MVRGGLWQGRGREGLSEADGRQDRPPKTLQHQKVESADKRGESEVK